MSTNNFKIAYDNNVIEYDNNNLSQYILIESKYSFEIKNHQRNAIGRCLDKSNDKGLRNKHKEFLDQLKTSSAFKICSVPLKKLYKDENFILLFNENME